MPQILFIIDSGPQRGLGHLMRSISLAGELATGNRLQIISNNDEKTKELLEKNPFDYTLVDIMDSDEIIRVFGKSEPEIIITDLRSPDPPFLEYLKENCILLASMDDFNLCTFPSHVLFNGNSFGFTMDYHRSAPESRLYIGPEFLLLKKEYSIYHKKEKKIPEKVEKALVTFGGNDKNDLTVAAIRGLHQIKDIKIIKVTLPLFVKERTLAKIRRLDLGSSCIELVDFIEDMPRELFNSDIVITGGGASLNEAVCVGTPCITIPQANYEVHNSEFLEEKGAVINLGLGSQVKPETIKNEFINLAKDRKKREAMSRISHKMIDGLGSRRVAETILKEFGDRVGKND